MATAAPLMPKATAVWLLDNTALTFDQIADFCKLHPLEVKAIADGDAAQGIKGLDPILTGQLTPRPDHAGRGQSRHPAHPRRAESGRAGGPSAAARKARAIRRYRAARTGPNAILWLVRNHPELKDCAIMRLVGTTKSTIASIRERTHWNAATLAPMDPVTLGLASQIDLDFEVDRANKEKPAPVDTGATLLPAAETTARKEAEVAAAAPKPRDKPGGDMDVSAVFAKLKQIGGKGDEGKGEVTQRSLASLPPPPNSARSIFRAPASRLFRMTRSK